MLKVRAEFPSKTPVWAALGFRPADHPHYCAMNPADVVLAEGKDDGTLKVGFGTLPNAAKKFDVDDKTLGVLRDNLKDTHAEFEQMDASHEDGKVVLNFARKLGGRRLK